MGKQLGGFLPVTDMGLEGALCQTLVKEEAASKFRGKALAMSTNHEAPCGKGDLVLAPTTGYLYLFLFEEYLHT